MKQLVISVLLVILVQAGCTKVEDTRTNGTDTIDNIRYMSTTYFTYGFSFSQAKLISTEATPKPDITVDTITGPRPNVYLQGSVNSAFRKHGDYPNEAAAQSAFGALKEITAGTWQEWANPVLSNQIWLYRSTDEKYTKIRIISIKQRKEQGIPVAEITFQWVHQPDGSLLFQ